MMASTILQILRDPGRKPLPTIMKETVSYCVRNKENPGLYVTNMLYRTEAGDPRAYISRNETRKLQLYQRNAAIGQFFANKVLFYHHLNASDIQLPKVLGYNVGNQMFLTREHRSIEAFGDFRNMLEELLLESQRIFLKPAIGAGGGNAVQLSQNDRDTSKLAAIHNRIKSTSYIFQERVRQHADLDAFYSGSVNSVRVVTCMRGSDIEVLSAVIRFGAGDSYVDNASSGGLFVGVDLETGKLKAPARKYFKSGGGLYTSHPDTGRSFVDFTIPFFAAVRDTAIECCRHLPYKLVGWDIAVTDEGPVVLEGNDWPGLDLVQIAYGGYKSHPTFGPFLEEILSSRSSPAQLP